MNLFPADLQPKYSTGTMPRGRGSSRQCGGRRASSATTPTDSGSQGTQCEGGGSPRGAERLLQSGLQLSHAEHALYSVNGTAVLEEDQGRQSLDAVLGCQGRVPVGVDLDKDHPITQARRHFLCVGEEARGSFVEAAHGKRDSTGRATLLAVDLPS